MINENLLVQGYLNGENINPSIKYRICFLLAKWYKESGITEYREIRKNILKWLSDNNITNDFYLYNCIMNALNDKKRLTTDNVIRVSKEDIDYIKELFDPNLIRLVALAVLCYFKQFADSNNSAELQITALADWVGIHQSNFSRRYVNQLIDSGYLTKNTSNQNEHSWCKDYKSAKDRYTISASLKNTGEYVLEGNDIKKLYNEIFVK